jgi:hypothetical protein
MLLPGRSGIVYLTDQDYPSGAEAAALLAIPPIGPVLDWLGNQIWPSKPVEVRCEIPEGALTAGIGPAEPVPVLINDSTKDVIHSGGGRQYRYKGAIPIRGLPWEALQSP